MAQYFMNGDIYGNKIMHFAPIQCCVGISRSSLCNFMEKIDDHFVKYRISRKFGMELNLAVGKFFVQIAKFISLIANSLKQPLNRQI